MADFSKHLFSVSIRSFNVSISVCSQVCVRGGGGAGSSSPQGSDPSCPSLFKPMEPPHRAETEPGVLGGRWEKVSEPQASPLRAPSRRGRGPRNAERVVGALQASGPGSPPSSLPPGLAPVRAAPPPAPRLPSRLPLRHPRQPRRRCRARSSLAAVAAAPPNFPGSRRR